MSAEQANENTQADEKHETPRIERKSVAEGTRVYLERKRIS